MPRRAALLLSFGLLASSPALAQTLLAVSVAGVAVDPDADVMSRARALAQAYADEAIVVALPEGERTLTRGALGMSVDEPALRRWLVESADPLSPLRAYAEDHHDGPLAELALPLPTSLDVARARTTLEELRREVDQPAIDAQIDPSTGTVAPEQEGRTLDVWASLDALYAANDPTTRRVELAVVRQAPRRRAAQLQGLQADHVLGHFSTPYNAAEVAADRTHNLRVVAEHIDGLVLMPGEVFDFNEVVGERSLANGFRPATVIAAGELVDGVGGGACQIAGTLHAAAFFAGLEIVERSPHSRPSFYIKLGLDAAVSYPNINFRFRNDRDFPVLVRTWVEGGEARAEIRGLPQEQLVSYVRRVERFIPFEERTREDDSLPTGVRVLAQRGVAGFELTRYRVVRELATNRAVRQRQDTDTYPPTTQIWRVGTGGPRPEGYEPPAGDNHPEYRADEYTVMTQGAGVSDTQTVRRAGDTGRAGWTERAGMPSADPARFETES